MNIVKEIDESVWKAAMGGMSYKGITWEDLIVANDKPVGVVASQFIKMALESLNADHKVWVWSVDNSLHIYVSAKSDVKSDLLDSEIWVDTDSPYEEIVDAVYVSSVDGVDVYINFLKKGVSVFDLVGELGLAVNNRAGFRVSPPTVKVASNYFENGSVDSLDDEIPF